MHWLANSYAQRVVALGGLSVYGENKQRNERTDGPRIRGPIIDAEHFWPPSQHPNLNADIDVEDISQLTMQMQNGAFGTYQQCHFTPDYWRNYCVIGDEGRLENFGNGEDGTAIHVWNTRKMGYNAPDEIHIVERPQGGHGGADPRIVRRISALRARWRTHQYFAARCALFRRCGLRGDRFDSQQWRTAAGERSR